MSQASLALAVQEIEPGQFRWMLLDEVDSPGDHLSYSPRSVSTAYGDAGAAWVAGYLALRAALRKGMGPRSQPLER